MVKSRVSISMLLGMALLLTFGRGVSISAPPPTQSPYPTGNISIVVPQKAGGSTDIIARTVQPYLSKYIGASVIVENVEGAGGKTGILRAYNAKPDGHTLLLGVFPAWVITQEVEKTSYDMMKMTAIANVSGHDYNVLAVPYESPIKNLNDLKSASQAKSIKVSGSGLGTNSYISFILLKEKVGAKVVYVPYTSGSDAALAVVGKHVDASVGSSISFKPLESDKKIRVIACMGPTRSIQFPDAPTLEEMGYKGAAFDINMGINAPAGVPAHVKAKLSMAMDKVLKDPKFLETANKANIDIVPGDSETYMKMIVSADNLVKSILPALQAAVAAQ
ncbi:MAG: tripartite tricarboxylate transporter substrate binding protein [Deltaproteobacteria bacterium]